MEDHPHVAPLDLIHRLEAIERTLEELETALVVLVERVNRCMALVRDDHYGVGRGGWRDAP